MHLLLNVLKLFKKFSFILENSALPSSVRSTCSSPSIAMMQSAPMASTNDISGESIYSYVASW